GIGRSGPFIKHGKIYANIKEVDEVFTIGMNRAMEELAAKAARTPGAGRAAAKPLAELGEHPTEGGPVQVLDGRYGAYVKWGKVNATLPKDTDPAALTMDEAVVLIAEKAGKAGAKKGAKKPAAKAKPAAKTAAKKPAAKKAPAKTATKTASKPAAKKTAPKASEG
ncbi:MAG: topoisomerase C-terminal repeat-containing protein, partial [Pararhodobacter sp.]